MIDDGLRPATVKPRGTSSTRRGFQWTCPYCETSRVNASEDESGRGNALVALRTHVVASEGDQHGHRHEYPPEFDDVALTQHVEWVDERERRAEPGG